MFMLCRARRRLARLWEIAQEGCMNHARVRGWAQGAIDKYSAYVVQDRLWKAFGRLQTLRLDGNTELELAVAEHYMFLRFCNCAVGLNPVIPIVSGVTAWDYDGPLKLIDTVTKRAAGIGIVPRLGAPPTSP